MERPSLRRDQRFPPPHEMDFGQPQQQWRPMTGAHIPSSRFRSVSDHLVLPQISSLLKGNGSSSRKELKRKLPLDEPAALLEPNQEPIRPANTARVVMYLPQSDEQLRVRRPSVRSSARDWEQSRIPAMREDLSSGRHPHGTRGQETPVDIYESRRLLFQHSVDPHKIHEVPIVPPYRAEMARKLSRYQNQVSPAYYEEDLEVAASKRRRVCPSLTPPAQSRQPLYEAEYGLTVLETSKPLGHSRYSPSMEHMTEPAPRRRYVRGFEKVASSVTTGPRFSYNGGGSVGRMQTNAPPPPAAAAATRTQANAGSRESSPLSALVLKSKEFLKSKSLVRNRHDEIDWVATFLKVGFDSSSIYALMCPLRKGRWKSEEENYTMGLLKLIENGTILLRHGQSIRGYVGEKLHSDDMRVLKKLSNYKLFHFAKLINPRLAEEEKLDMKVAGAEEGLQQLGQLKGEFLRSVQLEALVAVRKYLSDSSLRDLLNVRA